LLLLLVAICLAIGTASGQSTPRPGQPNILFCIADDWGWPHAAA